MKYDDASWHYGGDFPKNSPIEYGATHMGIFVKLMFENGLASECVKKDFGEEFEAVIDGKMTGTDYVFKCMDGKMTDEDFNAKGNEFARVYYSSENKDFADFLGDLMSEGGIELYEQSETAANFSHLRTRFKERLKFFDDNFSKPEKSSMPNSGNNVFGGGNR